MFRQADTFAGGWNEKTIESMRRRRFENRVRQLSALGAESLENIGTHAFQRKLEHCWQEIEKKPIRKQQEASVKSAVLLSLERHADCLSHEEHELVERALILGGSVQINDLAELDAAMALSLRFWAHVGLVDGKPLYEIVGEKVAEWGEAHMGDEYSYVGAVVGATYPEMGKVLRKVMPKAYILVPGYGAQGGKGKDLVHFFNEDGLGAIVNSSRGIIAAYKQEAYAKFGAENFGEASRAAVIDMVNDISDALNNR